MQIKRHILQLFLLLNVLFCKNPNIKPSYFADLPILNCTKSQIHPPLNRFHIRGLYHRLFSPRCYPTELHTHKKPPRLIAEEEYSHLPSIVIVIH